MRVTDSEEITMHMTVKGKRYEVTGIAQASQVYAQLRDASGQGVSRFPGGKIFDSGRQIAYVSYNAKVWAGTFYDPEAKPVYNPYEQATA